MGAVTPVPQIFGREADIQALGRIASGEPPIVLIEGEAGIGKTRLLAEAPEDARGRGMQVAAAQAEELERTRPFGLDRICSGRDRLGTSVYRRASSLPSDVLPILRSGFSGLSVRVTCAVS